MSEVPLCHTGGAGTGGGSRVFCFLLAREGLESVHRRVDYRERDRENERESAHVCT